MFHTLEDLGFLIKFEKSQLNPSTGITYIGYTISNVQDRLIIKVKTSRISKLKRAIRRAMTCQCESTVWAVTPGKLLLRNIYRLLNTRDSWKSDLKISKKVITELKWW